MRASIDRAEARFAAVRSRELAYDPGLRMWAKPGESVVDFRGRCRAAAVRAARAEVLELDNQSSRALDRLAEITEGGDGDVEELRLHLAGVLADLRRAKNTSDAVADEIEADWMNMSGEIEMHTLTIDPDADLAVVPWILWIPA